MNKIDVMIQEILKSYRLPEGAVVWMTNHSKKNQQETSQTLCIVEKEYPAPSNGTIKTFPFCVLNRNSRNPLELLIGKPQLDKLGYSFRDDSIIVREVTPNSIKVVFPKESKEYYDFIRSNLIYCLDNYKSSQGSFGCCSRYAECSKQKMCLHENLLYATGCMYRGNLENGKIFY